MTERDLQEALKTLKDYAVSINSAVSTLVDALNILTTSTQTLPEEQGYYLTQQHGLLLKDWDDAWSMRASDGRATVGFWDDTTFTKDSNVVVTKLSPDAFPLVPLSEVILPSEHIEEED